MTDKYRFNSIIQLNNEKPKVVMAIGYITQSEIGVTGIGKFEQYQFAFSRRNFDSDIASNRITVLSY